MVFKDGPTIIGSAYHSSASPAIFTTSDLSAGRHRISAVYLGGDTFDGEALIHFAPSRSRTRFHYVLPGLLTSSAAAELRLPPASPSG